MPNDAVVCIEPLLSILRSSTEPEVLYNAERARRIEVFDRGQGTTKVKQRTGA